MTTVPLIVQRFVLSTGTVGWLLYRSGHFQTPIAALTDGEMTQFLRDIESQIERAIEKGRPQ